MKTNHRLLLSLCLCVFAVAPALADHQRSSNVECPVASPYPDGSFEDKFGYDVLDKLRCNKRRSEVKMVMQVNAALDSKTRMYGFRNLPNIINDLDITHEVKKREIAVVVHSGGYPLILDPSPSAADPHPNAWINDQVVTAPFGALGLTGAQAVEKLIDMGVDVYFCLNTAAAVGITTDQILPGVKFVPAGLSSIVDFQYQGYKYVQP